MKYYRDLNDARLNESRLADKNKTSEGTGSAFVHRVHSRSYSKPLSNCRHLLRPMWPPVRASSGRKRAIRSCCPFFIQTNPFCGTDDQYAGPIEIRLPVASSNGQELVKYAMWTLQRIFKPGYNYHKFGVTALDLVPQKSVQLGMFDVRDRSKDTRLMQARDKTNTQFGKDIVRYVSARNQFDAIAHDADRQLLEMNNTEHVNELLHLGRKEAEAYVYMYFKE